MSEATLYAIDSAQVTDPATAADFLDQPSSTEGPPTAGMASFFEQLLQVWPEDGSSGQVWYEDFTHNKPGGAVLEITFELSEFDEKRLGQLRLIAGQHGLHVFDPEGEILYLADGAEAGG